MTDDVVALQRNNMFLQERLAELEFYLEDQSWTRIGESFEREFSRDGLKKISRASRLMYLWNPLIRRAVNLRGYYTWGQGVEVSCDDKRINTIIQEHMDDSANNEDLYGDVARLESDEELHNTGNLFSILFTRSNGKVDLRSVPAEQISRIITNPNDQKDVWYYERQWQIKGEMHKELYPDVLYKPIDKPATYDGLKVNWDAPIAHLKAGGQKFMLFGVPETYPALDWARSHREFLEDWVSMVKSLSRFAWKVISDNPVEDAKKLNTALDGSDGNAPLAGSAAFGSAGWDMQAIPKSGATVVVDDSRQLRLMVASAMDLPDTFLSGDVDVGNFATSKTLDRPTEMMIKFRQKRWANYWEKILHFVIEQQIRRGNLGGRIRRVAGRETVEFTDTISIRFPDVLEHSPRERIDALVAAATLNGSADAGTVPPDVLTRELLVSLGVEDVDEVMQKMNLQSEGSTKLAMAFNQLNEALKK